ncbi:MAG: hypothetical protein ABEI86_03025, partial [Halobacteriaceae archaeon]
MTNLHQTCTSACHDSGFPINATYDNGTLSKKHGPFRNETMVQGSYFCGPGCHLGEDDAGSDKKLGTLAAAHVLALGNDSKTFEPNTYCPRCHKKDLDGVKDRGIISQHLRKGTNIYQV